MLRPRPNHCPTLRLRVRIMPNAIPERAGGRAYASRWFWRLPQLATAVGLDQEAVLGLIRAGCAPGAIYAWREGWWSALAACRGTASPAPPPGAECYFAPSAAWDLRRAMLLIRAGATPEGAAAANRAEFVRRFIACLPDEPGAEEAFPQCWQEGRLDPALAGKAAEREWATWLQGAYGVCLRTFTAQNCIRKETLAARLRRRVGEADPLLLLDEARELAGLILPFAPWERAEGTPGRTIDALLARARLGDDLPYC
jgi:hypothetical protein